MKAVTLSLLIAFSQPTFAEPLAWQTWNAQQISESDEGDYTETSLRRGEIVFFLALPFVAIANMLVFSTGYYIYDPTYDFTLASLPPWFLVTMGVSTVSMTLFIAINDGKNNREPADLNSLYKSPVINLGLSRNF